MSGKKQEDLFTLRWLLCIVLPPLSISSLISQKKLCNACSCGCVCVSVYITGGFLIPEKLTGDVPLSLVISPPQNSWPPASALAQAQSASISNILSKVSAVLADCESHSVCVCVWCVWMPLSVFLLSHYVTVFKCFSPSVSYCSKAFSWSHRRSDPVFTDCF